jgi:hypothetical protein
MFVILSDDLFLPVTLYDIASWFISCVFIPLQI